MAKKKSNNICSSGKPHVVGKKSGEGQFMSGEKYNFVSCATNREGKRFDLGDTILWEDPDHEWTKEELEKFEEEGESPKDLIFTGKINKIFHLRNRDIQVSLGETKPYSIGRLDIDDLEKVE